MAKYRVYATYHRYLYIDIEADNEREAYIKAKCIDMDEFIDDPVGGDFDLDEYEQPENPRAL